MAANELKWIVEALLLSSDRPVPIEKITALFDEWQKPTQEQMMAVFETLKKEYQERSFELVQLASGYVIRTKKNYSTWISRLQLEKPIKYSKALLETLAIIAYKQPVTRADIEELRGVAVNSQIMKTLLEREWIRIAGHKDVAGKPAVYTTTKEFLNYFNLKHLNELPPILNPLETRETNKS